MISSSIFGPLASTLSSVTWTLGTTTYSRLTRHYPAFVINFNRALIALPLYVLASFLTVSTFHEGVQQFLNVPVENMVWLFISMFASFAFADSLFFWSTLSLGVPAALSIAACYPLWSALAGLFFKGERLTVGQWFGLIMIVAGVIIVIISGHPRFLKIKSQDLSPTTTTQDGPPPLLHRYGVGVALAFATSILWSLNTYSISKGGAGISTFVGNSIRMTAAIILAPLVALLMGQRARVIMKRETYKRSAWIFAVEAFGGSFFFMYGLTHTSLAIASALSSLAPVVSVPLTWGQEPLSLIKILGIISVVFGIWFLVGMA